MKINIRDFVACGGDRIFLFATAFIAGLIVMWLIMRQRIEGFDSQCTVCGGSQPCGCTTESQPRRRCADCPKMPDMSKYVLKTTVPPCPPMPDMSKYILKTEVPPLPDMSKYVLKSSVPKCPPCIAGCTKPCEIGECPPCPRLRCPAVPPCPRTSCPPCPPCERQTCPTPDVKCRTVLDYSNTTPNKVKPVLAPLTGFGF